MSEKTCVPPFCAPLAVWISTSLLGCGAPHESVQVELLVVADGSGMKRVTTDLGYEVTVTEVRMMMQKLTFATSGELLTESAFRSVYDWAVPSANAHSGHYEGGDITGELRQRLVIEWIPNEFHNLGTATLLEGAYKSANLTLTEATESDELMAFDALLNHAAVLCGKAARDDEVQDFCASIEVPDPNELVGIPSEFAVKADSLETLHLKLRSVDEEGDTLFDGIEFQALEKDDRGLAQIVSDPSDKAAMDAYIALQSALLTHDFFRIEAH